LVQNDPKRYLQKINKRAQRHAANEMSRKKAKKKQNRYRDLTIK